jgi:hypothetical protein
MKTSEVFTKWPSLWQNVPELQPEGLRYDEDSGNWLWILETAEIDTMPGPGPLDDRIVNVLATIRPATADALCREAAIRWLAARDHNLFGRNGEWVVIWNNHPDSFYMGTTANVALFSACVGVLMALNA